MFNQHGSNMDMQIDQRVPLERETRATLTTPEAAWHLNRRPQTLRAWAMRDAGPLRPVRVNGRLAWPVIDLKRVLGLQT